MILADKIIDLRKKNGLSQEELAEKMNVSRQSVSKWESAQSVPDLNKIIMLSEIFGVSTDYLLKDSLEAPEIKVTEDSGTALRKVSMEDANEFLDKNEKYASGLALGTLICILSVIPMLMLGALSEQPGFGFLAGIGIAAMLVIIAPAVAIFIRTGNSMEKFTYLETDPVDTAYGVDGMVKERREQFRPVSEKSIVTGVVMCIIGAAIFVFSAIFSEHFGSYDAVFGAAGLCVMLMLVAAGVYMIVKSSTIMGGFGRLLEEGEYSRKNKSSRSGGMTVVGIYWIVLVAVYLTVSFLNNGWGRTWIIFAVGGVLTPVVSAVQDAISSKKDK